MFFDHQYLQTMEVLFALKAFQRALLLHQYLKGDLLDSLMSQSYKQYRQGALQWILLQGQRHQEDDEAHLFQDLEVR